MIQGKADDAPGITLGEMGAFVQEAMRAGADGSEVPHVRVTFKGTAKSLSLNVTSQGGTE